MNIDKSIAKFMEEVLSTSTRFDAKMRQHSAPLYHALIQVLVIAVILVAIGVFFNIIGWQNVNIFLSIISLIGGVLAFTHPELLITIANFDLINRALPEKFQMDAFDALFDTFIRIAKRIIAFCCGLFLFLGVFPIKEHLKIFIVMVLCIIIFALINVKDEIATTRTERGK